MTIFIFFAFCYLLLTRVPSAFADITLGVFPPILQIDSTPPATVNAPLTILNDSQTPVTAEISFREFTQSQDNNGQLEYLGPTETSGADPLFPSHVQILEGNQQINEITLSPKQHKTLTLNIDIPKGEPPSDYYFSVIFLSKDVSTDQKNATSLSGGIATNVLLSIGPKKPATGEIDEFSSPWLVTSGPIAFTVSVFNQSQYFVAPQGQIRTTNMYGQTVGSINLLPVNILSNTSRFLPDTKDNNLITAVWPEKFLLGPYKATLRVALTPQGPLLTKTIYFVAIPLPIIIFSSILILLIVFITLRVRKNLKNI